ncbi:MAG: hypothetical protein JRN26_01135 [Nitrososphaerota archaeon]|nr:hypothetical protein [Nitrososphaerota archaeon]MDG6935483.1 hypothetical protein [Nitrososphaerota archaeon]MDG6943616.1 hypothetical protein [Nitrososphaerota archaeon]
MGGFVNRKTSRIEQVNEYVKRVKEGIRGNLLKALKDGDKIDAVKEYVLENYREFLRQMKASRDVSVISSSFEEIPPLYALPVFFSLSKKDKAEYANAFLEYLKAVLKTRKERIDIMDTIAFGIFDYCNSNSLVGINRDALKTVFLEFFSSNNARVRIEAWFRLSMLLYMGIITKEEVIQRKGSFLELLLSDYEWIKIYAWERVGYLLDMGIITEADVVERKESFLELLSSDYKWVIKSAWDSVFSLLDRGIITKDDKQRFLKLLRTDDSEFSAYAWTLVPDLIELGVLRRND